MVRVSLTLGTWWRGWNGVWYESTLSFDIYRPMQEIGSVSASPQRFLSPALPLQRMKARERLGRKQTSATAWGERSVISSTHSPNATDPSQVGRELPHK